MKPIQSAAVVRHPSENGCFMNGDRPASRPDPRIRARSASAFTLIELMVVMSIILILAGMTIPVAKSVHAKAQRADTTNTATQLRNAITTYATEYRRFPVRHSGSDTNDVELISDHALMDILLGSDSEAEQGGLNSRRRSFFSGKKASGGRHPRNGVNYDDGGGGSLYDLWGNPFRLIIDADHNERCVDPENPARSIAQDVLVWSPGPNGKDDRGAEDDIATWR